METALTGISEFDDVQAHLLEPVDDIVQRLEAKYGPANRVYNYLGKTKGKHLLRTLPVLTGVSPRYRVSPKSPLTVDR